MPNEEARRSYKKDHTLSGSRLPDIDVDNEAGVSEALNLASFTSPTIHLLFEPDVQAQFEAWQDALEVRCVPDRCDKHCHAIASSDKYEAGEERSTIAHLQRLLHGDSPDLPDHVLDRSDPLDDSDFKDEANPRRPYVISAWFIRRLIRLDILEPMFTGSVDPDHTSQYDYHGINADDWSRGLILLMYMDYMGMPV